MLAGPEKGQGLQRRKYGREGKKPPRLGLNVQEQHCPGPTSPKRVKKVVNISVSMPCRVRAPCMCGLLSQVRAKVSQRAG
jgi:hypothetical protein